MVTAPAVGPTLGGWLTDNYSWHWCFLINLPVGLLSLTLVQLFVVEPEALKQDRRRLLAGGLRVDYIGFALTVLGFGALQIMLDRYERDDGFSSDFITVLGVIAAVSLLTLAVWEIWHPQPAMNVRLLRSRAFAISCAVMFLFGVLLISTTQLLPQLAQTLLNYDARTAGLTLGVGGLATLVLMPLAGVVTGRLVQPKWLILMALAGTGWALLCRRTARPRHRLLEPLDAADDAGGVAAVRVHPAECRLAMSACRPIAPTRHRRSST